MWLSAEGLSLGREGHEQARKVPPKRPNAIIVQPAEIHAAGQEEGAGGSIELNSEYDDDNRDARRVQLIKDPIKPTQMTVYDHNITHLPCRDWCPRSVVGSAPSRTHDKVKTEGCNSPHDVCAYCYLGDKEGGHADNILASHALTEHSYSDQARNDRLKTAHDSHRRHIKVVKTTEGDIDGNATLKAAED